MFDLPALTPPKLENISIVRPAEERPQPKEYLVIDGDNLSKIAEAQATTVARLWAKNADLQDPDLLTVGQKLIIATLDENLPDRPLPPKIQAEPIKNAPNQQYNPKPVSTSGNTYAPGNCTYYAKQVRPDLPNNLGNANSWGYNAKRNGFTVSPTPQVGSVGVALNYTHVVIIQAVHGSTVTLSEMNYRGYGIVSTRVAPISEFVYIH